MPGYHPNSQKEAFFQVTAELLGRGYALTQNEVKFIMPYYGYESPTTSANIISQKGAVQLLAASGVELIVEKYRGQNIYYDGSLSPDEIDKNEARKTIDKKIESGVRTRANAMAARQAVNT